MDGVQELDGGASSNTLPVLARWIFYFCVYSNTIELGWANFRGASCCICFYGFAHKSYLCYVLN